MNKIKIIDANIIIRFLVWDNNKSLFNKSIEIIKSIESWEINVYILESVLLECIFVLVKFYKIPKKTVAEDIKNILYLENIINEDKIIFIEALNLFSNKNIDFVDCLIVTKAKFNDFEILTLDNKLLKELIS